jgi:DNA-binding CsgD family transcriptional regulator
MLNPSRFPDHATQQVNTHYQLFSRRERECLYYLSRAKTAKEISRILNVSTRTIEHYIENIKIKTGISTRTELIAYAISLFS